MESWGPQQEKGGALLRGLRRTDIEVKGGRLVRRFYIFTVHWSSAPVNSCYYLINKLIA